MPEMALVVRLAAVVAAVRAAVEAVDRLRDVLERRPGLLASEPQRPVLVDRVVPPAANLPGKIGADGSADDDVVALEQTSWFTQMSSP
jgi:hypothetical protein